MPKIKTHQCTAKRFKITGSGKVLRTKGGKSHLRRNRSKRVRRDYWKMLEVTTNGEIRRVKRLAPYLSKSES